MAIQARGGIDLGGTKILAGVFEPNFNCLARIKISTKPERGPEGVIERIARCVRDAVDESDLSMKQIRGIGIGARAICWAGCWSSAKISI